MAASLSKSKGGTFCVESEVGSPEHGSPKPPDPCVYTALLTRITPKTAALEVLIEICWISAGSKRALWLLNLTQKGVNYARLPQGFEKDVGVTFLDFRPGFGHWCYEKYLLLRQR